jgi:hypothetical protein
VRGDPAIDEIYEVRREISAEFGDDPRRLMAHCAEYEKQLEREGWKFYQTRIEEDEMVLRDKPQRK